MKLRRRTVLRRRRLGCAWARRRAGADFSNYVPRWGTVFPALLLLLAATSLRAQENSGTTLKLNVRLVDVFVNVTDSNGAIVGGLSKGDFALYEDGRPQTIALFERQSQVPLALTLAMDTSGSVKKDLGAEAAAAKRFVRAVLRPQDQMSVLQFATEVSVLAPFTNKVSQVDRALNHLHTGWATAFYDAVCAGSEALGHKQGRKVLVVVSDGDDTAEDSSYAQALQAALRNDVMVYSIIDVPIAASAGRDTGGEHALITLSEQTGGKYYYVDETGLEESFQKVSEDLRTEYLLGYYPKDQVRGVSFHRITVTIPRAAPGAFHIGHRVGYYADSPAAPSYPQEHR